MSKKIKDRPQKPTGPVPISHPGDETPEELRMKPTSPSPSPTADRELIKPDKCPNCGTAGFLDLPDSADDADRRCRKCGWGEKSTSKKQDEPVQEPSPFKFPKFGPGQIELSSFDAWEIRGAMIEAERLHDLARSHERHAEVIAQKAVTDAGQIFDKHWQIHIDAKARRVVLRRGSQE